jgi:hypothetical protein
MQLFYKSADMIVKEHTHDEPLEEETEESYVDLTEYVAKMMDQHIAKSTKKQHDAYVYQNATFVLWLL